MTDPIYAHARLAPAYDAFEADRADLDAYVELAEQLDAHRIVDLGCGTGCLALRLIGPGRTVIGVDPAHESLRVARRKSGARSVDWIDGDATRIPANPSADLVLMTGNAAQAILTDAAWQSTLRHIRSVLAPSGRFAFETRRPDRKAWLEWIDPPATTAEVPGAGTVERHLELTAVDMPLVSFRYTYRFLATDTTLISDSTIRFRDQAEIEADLHANGLVAEDIREAPDRPGRELVLIAAAG